MTPERIALMTNDDRERCTQCNEIIKDEPQVFNDYDEAFCTKDCLDSWTNNQAEAAYERFCERFYGGEVVTVDEQHRAAWEEKRGLR